MPPDCTDISGKPSSVCEVTGSANVGIAWAEAMQLRHTSKDSLAVVYVGQRKSDGGMFYIIMLYYDVLCFSIIFMFLLLYFNYIVHAAQACIIHLHATFKICVCIDYMNNYEKLS